MSETQNPIIKSDDKNDNAVDNKKSKKPGKFRLALIRVFACLFWVDIITRIVGFNYQYYLLENNHQKLSWVQYWPILTVAFFTVLLVVVFLTLFRKQKRWILYTLFFPLAALFWHLPKYIVTRKRWFLGITLLRSTAQLFRSFWQVLFVSISIYISLIFLAYTHNPVIQWIVIIIYSIIIVFLYIHVIKSIFKPSLEMELVRKVSPMLERLKSRMGKNTRDKNIAAHVDDPVNSSTDSTKKEIVTENDILGYSVIANRLLLCIAKKLKDYAKRNYEYAFIVLSRVLFLILIIFMFSTINYCVYLLNTNAYAVRTGGTANYFQIFYYTFSTFFLTSISSLIPSSVLTQILEMLMKVLGVLTGATLIGSIISILKRKHDNEVDTMIDIMHAEGESVINAALASNKLDNINDAMSELRDAKWSLYNFVMYLDKFLSD